MKRLSIFLVIACCIVCRAQSSPSRFPSAPPIYAKGLTLQQGHHVERIAASITVFEENLTGGGNDPVWNESDVLDSPKIVETINLAISSGNNSQVMETGGERALRFVQRVQRLNDSLADIPSNAGIPNSPISTVISGRDFRIQIALKQREIAVALQTYPEFSRAFVRWQFLIADTADPK